MVDIMDKFQKLVGVDLLFQHQAAQGGAVAVIEILLDHPRLIKPQIHQTCHIGGHALVNLSEQVGVLRIQGIVEIEYPFTHMVKGCQVFRVVRFDFFNGHCVSIC